MRPKPTRLEIAAAPAASGSCFPARADPLPGLGVGLAEFRGPVDPQRATIAGLCAEVTLVAGSEFLVRLSEPLSLPPLAVASAPIRARTALLLAGRARVAIAFPALDPVSLAILALAELAARRTRQALLTSRLAPQDVDAAWRRSQWPEATTGFRRALLPHSFACAGAPCLACCFFPPSRGFARRRRRVLRDALDKDASTLAISDAAAAKMAAVIRLRRSAAAMRAGKVPGSGRVLLSRAAHRPAFRIAPAMAMRAAPPALRGGLGLTQGA